MSSQEELTKKAKGISLRFLVIAVIFLVALVLFGFIADEMVLENEKHFDEVAFDQLRQITNPGMTNVMVAITFFGSSFFLLPAYTLLIAFYLFVKKDRKLSWDVAAVGITSTMILFSLKAIFKRHRPLDPLVQHVNGFSFPSGHSFSSFTFFGLLIFIIWNQQMKPFLRWILTASFFLFACAIAFSRVYLHVHYASDVIAGVCLCVLWLGLSFWSLKKIDKSPE